MVQYRLSQTTGDNVISPNKAALVIGIMKGYEIDIAKILKRETYDRAVSTNTNLVFLCLLTRICLDELVPVISDIDNFLMIYRTTDLGLTQYHGNFISKDKVGASLLQENI